MDTPSGTTTAMTGDLSYAITPGIVTVQGLNGKRFSAHRWPCAERENLSVVADAAGQ